jgi:DNA primase large subunit
MLTDDHDALVERFRELFADALAEQAERYVQELICGVDAEREEEIRIWFLYNKESLARTREARNRLLN